MSSKSPGLFNKGTSCKYSTHCLSWAFTDDLKVPFQYSLVFSIIRNLMILRFLISYQDLLKNAICLLLETQLDHWVVQCWLIGLTKERDLPEPTIYLIDNSQPVNHVCINSTRISKSIQWMDQFGQFFIVYHSNYSLKTFAPEWALYTVLREDGCPHLMAYLSYVYTI